MGQSTSRNSCGGILSLSSSLSFVSAEMLPPPRGLLRLASHIKCGPRDSLHSCSLHTSSIDLCHHRIDVSLGLCFWASRAPSPDHKPTRSRSLVSVSHCGIPSIWNRVWPRGGPWCLLLSKHLNLSACSHLTEAWDLYPKGCGEPLWV